MSQDKLTHIVCGTNSHIAVHSNSSPTPPHFIDVLFKPTNIPINDTQTEEMNSEEINHLMYLARVYYKSCRHYIVFMNHNMIPLGTRTS